MHNYMVHIIRSKQYKRRYYNPYGGFTITSEHVSRLFGCHMGRIFSAFPYVEDTYFTRESLYAIGAVKESLPQYEFYICTDVCISWMIGTRRRTTTATWNGIKYTIMPSLNHHWMWRGTNVNSITLRMDSTSDGRNASTLNNGLPQTRAMSRVGTIR